MFAVIQLDAYPVRVLRVESTKFDGQKCLIQQLVAGVTKPALAKLLTIRHKGETLNPEDYQLIFY